jgi:hypothetical protein
VMVFMGFIMPAVNASHGLERVDGRHAPLVRSSP